MSLKAILAVVVIMALMDQSAACGATPPTATTIARGSATCPGFSFKRNHFKKVDVFANSGTLKSYEAICNITKWRPILGHGSTSFAITQNVTLPVLVATYNDTAATFGPYKGKGEAAADLSANTYNLTINATSQGSDSKSSCVLRVTLEPKTPGFPVLKMIVDDLGYPGALLARSVSLLTGVGKAAAESLKEVLPTRLAAFLREILAEKINPDDFCKQLLASNADKFPQVVFGDCGGCY